MDDNSVGDIIGSLQNHLVLTVIIEDSKKNTAPTLTTIAENYKIKVGETYSLTLPFPYDPDENETFDLSLEITNFELFPDFLKVNQNRFLSFKPSENSQAGLY